MSNPTPPSAGSLPMPAGFPTWVARHWNAVRKIRQTTERCTSGRNSYESRLDSWLESELIPAIHAGLPGGESVDIPAVAILALLVHLSHPRMKPPPERVCRALWELVPEAEAASVAAKGRRDAEDKGGGPSLLTWLAWMIVATGSGAWRRPNSPALEGEWGAVPWADANTELEIMAASALFKTLDSQFPVVPGFNEWLAKEAGGANHEAYLSKFARECAVNIVLGFTQRIGPEGAPASKDTKPRNKETYRYLCYWDPQLGALPGWILGMVRGYAGQSLEGLPNFFARGWAFAVVAPIIGMVQGKTALQPCKHQPDEDHPHRTENGDDQGIPKPKRKPVTHIFWKEKCDCGLPLQKVIEQDRFVMYPACGRGFFFLCKACQHYTFYSEYTAQEPSSSLLDALAAQIEDVLSAEPIDLGLAARDFIDSSEAPELLVNLAGWLIRRQPHPMITNGKELLGRCLEWLRRSKTNDLNTEELALLLLELLVELLADGKVELLADGKDEAADQEPQKPVNPKIKRPEGFVCSLCKSPTNPWSTFLWMRRSPGLALMSQTPSPFTDNVSED